VSEVIKMARYSDFASSDEAVLVETDDFALVYDRQNRAFRKKLWNSSTKSWIAKVAPYSALVAKDGSTVWAEDASGKIIASGEAGVDDASVIQSALNEIGSKGGGKIVIKSGNYRIAETIFINYSNIELCGEGIDKTVLVSEIWEKNFLNACSIIHSKDTEKLTGIFIHDLTIDSVYDYTTDIEKVWVTGIELTNVDDSVIYRCKAKNHFGSVFHVGAWERGANQRHDDYLGTKAVMYCMAERCTGEIFSVSYSTKCALIGNQTRDLVLQPAGQTPDARWCHVLNIEGTWDVLVANNNIVGLPVEEPKTQTAAVNAWGALRAIIVNNIFKAPSIPETPDKVNAIIWYMNDSGDAGLEFSHNYIKNLTCFFRRNYGSGATRNIRIRSNTIINGRISVYVDTAWEKDRTFADVDVSDNIIDLPDVDYHPLFVSASADPAISRGDNIKVNNNIINAPVNTESGVKGVCVQRALSAEVTGNLIKESPYIGVIISDSTYAIVKDNLIFNPGKYASLSDAACMQLEGCDYLIVEKNICINPQSYAIRIEPKTGGGGKVYIVRNTTKNCPYDVCQLSSYAFDYVELAENEFRDEGASISFAVTPSTLKIQRNKNYITENSGAATFSGDGTTTQFSIAHGLVSTPTKVLVTPMTADAASDFYVTVDDTNIYINYKSAPPSGTDNLKFSWYAEV